jgi:two-component system KDP operon response regulator KdpE
MKRRSGGHGSARPQTAATGERAARTEGLSGPGGPCGGGGALLRILVVSSNRIAGHGLVVLADGIGVSAAQVPLTDALTLGRGADLTLLYCDRWDADAQTTVRELHAARVRLLTVIAELSAAERREVLAAGALHAFTPDQSDELAVVLANFRWSAQATGSEFTLANGFVVDVGRREIRRPDGRIELTLTECELLALLRDAARERPGRPVAVGEIMNKVWGAADARSAATVRGHVSQLRTKVEADPARPLVLCGRRGAGYWLELETVARGAVGD